MVKTGVGELIFEEGFESFGFVRCEAWAGDAVDGYDSKGGAVWAKESDGGKASVWVTKGVIVGNASIPEKGDA